MTHTEKLHKYLYEHFIEQLSTSLEIYNFLNDKKGDAYKASLLLVKITNWESF